MSKIYEEITAKIIAAIEKGAPRFEMPWHTKGPNFSRPRNVSTKQPYNGINVLALWVATDERRFASNEWATYLQWQQLGCQVRKGEKSTGIVFWKKLDADESVEDDDEHVRRRFIARASRVFNADQVEGYLTAPTPPPLTVFQSIGMIEEIVRRIGVSLSYGHDRACYHPLSDTILMPDTERFFGSSTSSAEESFYATLLHELVHATGHSTRLDREFSRFGSEAYAMEELVAELGSAFLCADLGINNEPRLDHAAYIDSWLTVLKRDAKALFAASSRSASALRFIVRDDNNVVGRTNEKTAT